MSAVVGGTPGLRVVSAAPDGRDALWGFAQERHPRVLLVNLFLRDITGMEVVHRAKTLWPSMLPILLIPDDRLYLVIEALGSEARGYLPSPCPADEMVRAIWAVHRGGAIVSSSMSDAIVHHFRIRGSLLGRLTERERQVLRCLSCSLSQVDIALELGVDKETVHAHVRNILSKLNVHSTVAAVAFYLNPKLSSAAREPHLAVEA
jgi:DNA-binding NarL/FixJ family response regulator